MIQKNEESRNEINYLRDDLRRISGLYNPEKDEAIREFGQVRGQIGDFLGDKVRQIESQIEEKILKRIDNLERATTG